MLGHCEITELMEAILIKWVVASHSNKLIYGRPQQFSIYQLKACWEANRAAAGELCRQYWINQALWTMKRCKKGKRQVCLLTEPPVSEMVPRDPLTGVSKRSDLHYQSADWALSGSDSQRLGWRNIGQSRVLGINSDSRPVNGRVSKEDGGSIQFWACKWQKDLCFVAACLPCYLVYLFSTLKGKNECNNSSFFPSVCHIYWAWKHFSAGITFFLL